jgi:VWFA-related protein
MMRLRPASFFVLSLILSLSAFLAVSNAQVAAPSDDEPAPLVAPQSVDLPQDASQTSVPTLHVTTREVVADVEVTDANGNPVHGLKQSDFTIEENGKLQPIRSFREFGTAIPPPEHVLPKLPFGIYTNYQSIPASGPANILLFDAMHSGVGSIARSMHYASDYFGTMPKGTQVAVFLLSENGLHMLQGFTSDPATLQRAVQRIHIHGGANPDLYTSTRDTINAFNQIAAYVSGVKGRKNLLWFIQGMPVCLMRDGGYEWPACSWTGPPDMSIVHRLMDVYERFSAEQVAVSPIDPRGHLYGIGFAQVKADEVAEQSGGESFYDNNDLKATIAKAIDHGSQFYTLSYIPLQQTDDGHYHHLKIAIVDHPELHLVYRKGYDAERVPTPDAPAPGPAPLKSSRQVSVDLAFGRLDELRPGPALLKASLEGKAPAATQILFDASAWPIPPAAADPADPAATKVKSQTKARVPCEVQYGFPSSEIAFTEDADGMLSASLEFDIAAYNDLREQVAHQSQTVTMHLSLDQYDDFMSKPYHYTQKIDLPLGPVSVHVGILDNVTSKVGTLEVAVNVRPVNPSQRVAAPLKR